MDNLWTENIDMPRFRQLSGNAETDVLIVGGGLAGVLCAYMLQKEGVEYMLTEADRIGSGTTKGTTAVLTAQHGAVYTKITKKFGGDTAKDYLNANLDAIAEYEKLSKEFDFDLSYRDSYVYSIDDSKTLKLETAVVKELGFSAEYTDKTELPMKNAGAVRFPKMAQFHPMKLLAALSKGLRIYERTGIKRIDGNTAYYHGGCIRAKKIIITTHFPFINRKGLYPLKLYQKRSFVLALENAKKLDGTYADIAERGIYLRNYGELMLVGGGDHRTAVKNDGFEKVRHFAKEYFPNAKEKYAWAAQDCISLDDIPYIGEYSRTLKDVYVATGFNEWGMSTSMVAAAILRDKIIGKENKYAHVFSPVRKMLTRQTAVNAAESIIHLLSPGRKRCSHMGCALRKNEEEHTWDCPCHGSRFDMEGKIIDNPAVHDLR